MAEVVQTADVIKPAALVQVVPGELRTARTFRPIRVQHRHAAERVVDVAFDDVARVVKDRRDVVVSVLHHPPPLVQSAVAVAVVVAKYKDYAAGGWSITFCVIYDESIHIYII